jgi:hypothetical protein
MSPSNTPSNSTEQASWLSSPQPGRIESLRKIFTTRMDTLFDGAYLWFNGESILVPKFDPKKNVWRIDNQKPSRGKIIAINPGAEKVSRLLALSREGNSLALVQSRWGYEKLSHVEAENANLIREVHYAELFRYLGKDHLVKIMAWYGLIAHTLEQLIPWVKDLPSTAYQVTKEWQKSGIILVDEEHKPNIRPPFFGGPGSFRRRKHATSH